MKLMFSFIKYIIIKSDKLIRAAKKATNNSKISFILLSIATQFFTQRYSVHSLEYMIYFREFDTAHREMTTRRGICLI